MGLEQRLKEIKERCDAATEGPWANEGFRRIDAPNQAIYICNSQQKLTLGMCQTDVVFTSYARTDIPMLLEMVEAYRKFLVDCEPIAVTMHLKTTFEMKQELDKDLEKIAEKYYDPQT